MPLCSVASVLLSAFPSPCRVFASAGFFCCAVGCHCGWVGVTAAVTPPGRQSGKALVAGLKSVFLLCRPPPRGVAPCPPLSRGLSAVFLRLGGVSFRLCFFKHASKLEAIVCRAPLRAVVCAEVPQKEKSVLLQSARLRQNCYRQEGQAFPKVTVKNIGVFYSF